MNYRIVLPILAVGLSLAFYGFLKLQKKPDPHPLEETPVQKIVKNDTHPISATLEYRHGRYESTKDDCKRDERAPVSYHSVATIDLFPKKKINWKEMNSFKIFDKQNNLTATYKIDHEKSSENMIFYHMKLFGKKKHYEFIDLTEEDDDGSTLYLFYYYNLYEEVSQSNSNIVISALDKKGAAVFTTQDIPISYNTAAENKNFPVIKGFDKIPNSKKIKLNFDLLGAASKGNVQYKNEGKLNRIEFELKPEMKSLELNIDQYESYLAASIQNTEGFETKTVLFRTCEEFY